MNDVPAAQGSAEGAYAAVHRTGPETAAVELTDSPAGLAAGVVEARAFFRSDRAAAAG